MYSFTEGVNFDHCLKINSILANYPKFTSTINFRSRSV